MPTVSLCYTGVKSRPSRGDGREHQKKGEDIMKRVILGLLAALFLTASAPRAMAAQQGVEVGGIHILKTDVTGTPLKGAVFQLVREADTEELTDRALEKRLVRIGEENRLTAVMSFWTDRQMAGSRQTQVTTDSHGRAAIYGLPYGTYYLLETEAPQGYNRITAPIRLIIHRYSHLTEEDGFRDDEGELIDNRLHIINVRYTLPDTGSWGTIQLVAAGVGVLFSSAALLMMSTRRRHRQ